MTKLYVEAKQNSNTI